MRSIMVLILLLFSPAAYAAQEIAADQHAARILAYFRVGQDDFPQANVTREQFEEHLAALKAQGAHVLPLAKVIQAFEDKTPLPPKTVVITFDGNDKSIVTVAAPLLEEHNYPFTVFLMPSRIEAQSPHQLTWADVKALKRSPLSSLGLLAPFPSKNEETIRTYYNNATARLREHGIDKIEFLSFLEGRYDQQLLTISKRYGFTAQVGQNSGVAYKSGPDVVLPRYVMTEDFADPNRFNMIMQSLPLPVKDLTPTLSVLNDAHPSIGFTLNDALLEQKDQLSCYAAGQEKPALQWLGSRVEIRLASPIGDPRFRVNCTMSIKDEKNPETLYWRWLGLLMTRDEPLLEAQN